MSVCAMPLKQKPEETMNKRVLPIALALICGAGLIGFAVAQTNNPAQTTDPVNSGAGRDIGVSGAIEQKPLLTQAQRRAIYAEVSKDTSKSSPQEFPAVVGADVPPMIELYTLPEDALAQVPAAQLYKYTVVENKVVVVDPTKMRIIDVIEPPPKP
jgi:Protein of unknown function (DUF1236)